MAQLCSHYTVHQRRRRPILISKLSAWLTAYGSRRDVNVDASFPDSCLRCSRFGGFTDTGDSSTIDGLGATRDKPEGEYYRCHETLLKRLQWSSEYTSLGGSGNDGVDFILYSRPTSPRSRWVCTHPHPAFPSYLTVNVYACSSPTSALENTGMLSTKWRHQQVEPQISRFVEFKNVNLFAALYPFISVRFRQIQPTKYIQGHELHANLIQAED